MDKNHTFNVDFKILHINKNSFKWNLISTVLEEALEINTKNESKNSKLKWMNTKTQTQTDY